MREILSRSVFYSIVAVFVCMAFVSIATAQEEKEEAFTVKAESRYIDSSTVDDLNGEIQTNESKFKATYGYSLYNLLPVTIGLNIKHTDIKENLEAEYPSHLEGRSLELGTKFPMPFSDSGKYFMGVDVFPSLYTDDWNWKSSALRAPFRTYLVYKPE